MLECPRGARGIEPETFRRRGQLSSRPLTTGRDRVVTMRHRHALAHRRSARRRERVNTSVLARVHRDWSVLGLPILGGALQRSTYGGCHLHAQSPCSGVQWLVVANSLKLAPGPRHPPVWLAVFGMMRWTYTRQRLSLSHASERLPGHWFDRTTPPAAAHVCP